MYFCHLFEYPVVILVRDHGAADMDQAAVQVHAVPAKAQDLRAAHPQPDGQENWHLAAVPLYGLDQLADVLRLEVLLDRLDHLGQADAKNIDSALLEHGADQAVGIGHGLGRDQLGLLIDGSLNVGFGDLVDVALHKLGKAVLLGGAVAPYSGGRQDSGLAGDILLDGLV